MAKELVLTGTATATLVGAWELRAGSMDTTEWLDGAADVAYPGGGPGTFNASNSDGANGYDAAPKMALITITDGADAETVILTEGTTDTRTPTILAAMYSDANAAPIASGCTFATNTVTLQYASGTTNAGTLMVLYD
jgi:hypothetical protein